ncbi:MAG: hypothetical protein Q9186_005625 [Xanthomendoza sp. 1 TL-2023]
MSFATRRAAITSISALSAAALYYHTHQTSKPKTMLPSYEATFSVPLECDACINDIKGALSKVDGITSTTFSLPHRLISITSTTPPSTLISTIQSTGRDAILRGSGTPNSAAVCILEIPPSSSSSSPFTPPNSNSNSNSTPPRSKSSQNINSPVRGLARLITLSEKLTLLDLTLTAVPTGRYTISIRKTGDISRGKASLGSIYKGENGDREGELGVVSIDEQGRGNLVVEIGGWRVWELVGRGMCVERIDAHGAAEVVVVGVVARSAGVWENEKVVCGCSGKTVWEEREEMVGKGMV